MAGLDPSLTIEKLNARLEKEIEQRMPLGESVLFAGIALAMEESFVFVIDQLVNSLIKIGVLDQADYVPNVNALKNGLDNIRLRSLYDAVMVIESLTEEGEQEA